jgi:hypothetical protein
MMKKLFLIITVIVSMYPDAISQVKTQTNYDESKVTEFTLPDLLLSKTGMRITDSGSWNQIRRPEILSLFEENFYGKIPGILQMSTYIVIEGGNDALKGKAIRKQVILTFKNNGKELNVNILIYLPKNIKKAPLFVGYNFGGNQTVANDPVIFMTSSWVSNNASLGIKDNKANEKTRGSSKSNWPLAKIISSGYGLATIYYGDVDPDKNDFTDGVHPLLYTANQTKPLPDEWGSITAWAWGLSRAMDYFEKDVNIDAKKVIVMGHSRLGKTALWAGALDQRFAIVISNNSGCGGAALSRRIYGETIKDMNTTFPHWLCGNCFKYNDNENALPVDQHMLIALIAPRPVYIASAVEDKWADPKGEYLSGYYASPVYELFGKQGLPSITMPELNQPIMNTIGYHIRSGVHNVTDFDWEQYIKFADKHLKK